MKIRDEKGQSIVELALVLPILILLIGAIIDFGWLYSCQISANNAVREAARYTAIHIYDSSTDNDTLIAHDIVLDEAPQLPEGETTVTLSHLDLDGDGATDSVKISLTAPIKLMTGISSTILGKSEITISSATIMRIEN
jgi:archaellum component FlaF (FlaF/FlaG flagellin family)